MDLLSKLHAMKKYWRLLFIFILFSAKGWSQGITLSVDKQPLEKVLLLIEKQSGYNFIYSSEAMAQAKPVTVNVKDETLPNVLTLCFKGQPLNYSTTANRHIIVKLKNEEKPVSSNRELKGNVVNENGEAVAGVTISIKYSTLITVSDNKGEFFFKTAPSPVTLYVSGAEMEDQEIFVGNASFATVRVKAKLGTLDETIVIAYGKTTRRYLTESVVKIKAEEISRQPISNPILALAGRVTGLQVIQASGVPGSSIIVQLRGRNSIDNGNEPLYIVDGVPFPSESLHDALGAGGGIGGSPLDNLNPSSIESIEVLKDAAATAIYGSRGANGVILITTKKGIQGKTKVSLNTYTGFGKVTRKFDLLNTTEYLAMRREAFANDGITPTNSNAPDLNLWDTTRYTDWQKLLIGNTMQATDLNVAVSGGSAQTQFLTSSGYRKETSVFPGSFSAEKISGLANISHQSVDKKFSLYVSTSFLQNKSKLPREDLTNYIRTAPNAPSIYQSDGKLNWESSTWNNPYGKVMQVFTTHAETWRSNLNLEYRIASGLDIKLSGGYTSLSQQDHYTIPSTSVDPGFGIPASAGFGRKDIRTLIVEPQLNYSFTWKQRHKMDLLAGGSFQQSVQNNLHQRGRGYTSDELLNSLSSAATISNASESDIRYRYSAFFTRLNYEYFSKYLFTFTLRNDGSSRYAPANRFATFGSLGAGWIFSKEKLLAGSRLLNFGKLRLTAGITGNDQIGDYKYLDLYSAYDYPYFSLTTFAPVQLFSPSYGWEQVKKLEAGLDLSFLADRLSLTINYYHNTTTNQLVSYALPAITGFNGVLKNLPATIRNTGLELEVSGQIINRPTFKWSASLNLTIPRNKLVKFENFASSSYANSYAIGQPLFISKTYAFTAVNPSNGVYTFRDLNGDGAISTPADRQTFVNRSQQFFGGLHQTISNGKLTLNIHFQFTGQQHARNYIALFTRPGSLNNQPSWVMHRWQKQGQQTSIQRFTVSASEPNQAYSGLQASDAAFSNASFIRLRNLQLLYSLLESKNNSKQLMDLKFFIQGQNIFTITNYKGLDPETLTLLPPVRLLTGGIQLNF